MTSPARVTKKEDLAGAVRIQITLGPQRAADYGVNSLIEVRTAPGCDKCENYDASGQSWVIEGDAAGSYCDEHLFEYYMMEDTGPIVILAKGLKCSICGHLEESDDGMEQHYYAHDETLRALDDVLDKLAAGVSASVDLENRKHFETAYRVLLEHVDGSMELLGEMVKKRLHPADLGPKHKETTA